MRLFEMIRYLLFGAMLALVVAIPAADAQSKQPRQALTVAYPKVCRHGLYLQPRLGRFAVMLFCDDAQSSHIGVICYAPGCESAGDGPWGLADRFWQDDEWASDVSAFAWDANNECLYVSTGEIYGTGNLYALSLPRRRATKIAPEPRDANRSGYSTEVKRIDFVHKRLWYSISYFDDASQRETTIERSLKIPACS